MLDLIFNRLEIKKGTSSKVPLVTRLGLEPKTPTLKV